MRFHAGDPVRISIDLELPHTTAKGKAKVKMSSFVYARVCRLSEAGNDECWVQFGDQCVLISETYLAETDEGPHVPFCADHCGQD